jgi:hypothetical protein
MGLRLRLRPGYDLTGLDPQVAVILRAMQQHGIILADNGSPWHISGAPDERWDNGVLRQLARLHGSDFEVVDVSRLMAEPGSGRVRRLEPRSFLPSVAGGRSSPPASTPSPEAPCRIVAATARPPVCGGRLGTRLESPSREPASGAGFAATDGRGR